LVSGIRYGTNINKQRTIKSLWFDSETQKGAGIYWAPNRRSVISREQGWNKIFGTKKRAFESPGFGFKI